METATETKVKEEEVEEEEFICNKQVVCSKTALRYSHDSSATETGVITLQNLRALKAGSGMDDLESYREKQNCCNQQLNGRSLVEDEKTKKNLLKNEISDEQQQQQRLSNQLEMIAVDSSLAATAPTTTRNNDNDHSFEGRESFRSGNQTKRGGGGRGNKGEEEACYKITTASKTTMPLTAAATTTRMQRTEWNLMQIVESAESKLMRQKQARDEETKMLQLRQAAKQSAQQGNSNGNGDIIQIQNEDLIKSLIQSHAGNDNVSSCYESGTNAFRASNARKVSRSGLMLKSPAFATITFEKESGGEENSGKREEGEGEEEEEEEEGRGGEEKQLFACEQPPAMATAYNKTVVVSDCGRKFGAITSWEVGANGTSEADNNERPSEGSGCFTAGNMTNRVENKGPSQCSWSKEQSPTSLKYSTGRGSNVVGSGENLSQAKSSQSPLSSSSVASGVSAATNKTETPTTSSYKPYLLRNSPPNFGGRDEGTKQHHHHHQQQQQQQQRGGDCEEDDREGPTPTNDLIRALIQRDKVALSGRWYRQQQESSGATKDQVKVASNNPEEQPVAIDPSPSSWSTSSSNDTTNSNHNSKTGSSSPISSSPSPSLPSCHSQTRRRHELEPQRQAFQYSRATLALGQKQVKSNQDIEQVVGVVRPNRRKRKRTKQQIRTIAAQAKSKTSLARFDDQQEARKVLDCLTKTSRHSTTTTTTTAAAVAAAMRESVIRTETVEPNLTSSVDYYDYCTSKRIGFDDQKKAPNNNNNSELEISQIDTTTTTTTTPTSSSASNANTRQQLANKMLDTQSRDKQRPKWDSFAASALELSAQLISKCHLVASGHSDGGGVASSNRKPSDASLNSEGYNIQSIENSILEPRRHSTYMLPMLLNKDPNDNTLSSSSSSSSSSPSAASLSEHLFETGIANAESLSDLLAEEELSQVLNREPDLAFISSNRNLTDKEISTQFPNRPTNYLSQNPKLTTSASSPSALSTPTNDKGGCNGPCCGQPTATGVFGQTYLVGVTRGPRIERTHNAGVSVANEQANVMKRIRKLSLFSGNQVQGLIQATSDSHSKGKIRIKNSVVKQRQQEQQQPRRRTGSNPLERLRLTTNNYLTSSGDHQPERGTSIIKLSSPRARIQSIGATNELAKLSLKSGKRHSIINLLSGNGSNSNTNNSSGSASNVPNSNLFSSKLNPRSIFSTSLHRDGTKNNTNTVGSLEGSMNKTDITSSSWVENHLPFTNSSNKLPQIEQQQQDQQCEPLIPESGFKIVVMGTSGSGKTSIIQRFMYNSFNWRHLPTVEDTYFIEFPYKKNLINISISDTSGTYQFPAMKRLAINSGDAFILVYSVDNPDSFEELEQLRQTILNEREQAYLEASASLASSSNAVSSSQSSGLASTSSGCCSQSQISVLSGQQTNNNNNNHNNNNNNNNNNSKLLKDGGKDDGLPQMAPSPSRHWSLGSLFHHQHNNNTPTNNNNNTSGSNYSHNTSLSSSVCSSTCSSTDTSRRSSVSAAEAALRTRRTRRPPMVIVANKYDLPHDQHLVNSDEIEALAVIDWNNGFVRASAALNSNIDEIFQQVLKQARQPSTLADAILSKRRKSLPPKLPH